MFKLKRNEYEKSSIDIGDENTIKGDLSGRDMYKAGGDIVSGDKITGTGSKIYKVNKENVKIEKMIAPRLINNYGKKKVGIVGIISSIAGLIAIFTWVSSLPIWKVFSNLPAFPESVSKFVLVFGIILLLAGILLLKAVIYHSSTKCKKCGADFAYEEIEYPVRHDTETKEGTWRTETITYKCIYCGSVDKIESPPHLINTEL